MIRVVIVKLVVTNMIFGYPRDDKANSNKTTAKIKIKIKLIANSFNIYKIVFIYMHV